jgi:hypothetical protein
MATLAVASPAAADTTGRDQGAVLQVIAPAAVQSTADRSRDQAYVSGVDWTSRAPQASAAAKAGAPARPAVTHAQVAMFSWHEIVIAGLVLVVGFGAFLAFGGGGSGRRPRNP